MSAERDSRGVAKAVEDILDAASAGAELVARGRAAWDADRLLRLAGEAVLSRIGDAANKLPEAVKADLPAIPWDEIRANRILVVHIYHRIDYEVVWATLEQDVPRLAADLGGWLELDRTRTRDDERGRKAALISGSD